MQQTHRNLDVVGCGELEVGAISQAVRSGAADELTGREGSLFAERASAVGVRARRGWDGAPGLYSAGAIWDLLLRFQVEVQVEFAPSFWSPAKVADSRFSRGQRS